MATLMYFAKVGNEWMAFENSKHFGDMSVDIPIPVIAIEIELPDIEDGPDCVQVMAEYFATIKQRK